MNLEGHNYFLSQNPYLLNSYALFGETYYDITPDLKVTAGLRWTEDQKHFPTIPSELLIQGYGYATTNVIDQQWDQFTGRANVTWTPHTSFTDQTLIYGSYSHGYKAGGANPPGAVLLESAAYQPVHPLTLKPEFIDAFELGTKNNPVRFEKFPRYSMGGEGKLVFTPRGNDWVFTASVSYGRANGQKHVHEQHTIPPTPNPIFGGTIVPTLAKFVDTQNRYSSSHNVLDFRVGRDVGVGLFGGAITSQLSLGVRSAVFTSRSKLHISGHPDFHFIKNPPKYFPHVGGHEYYASAVESQSFRGIGPSISWEASAPLGRSQEDSRLSVDWGIDAAVLFGRQRVSSHHHTSASYYQVPPIKYPGVALYNTSGGSQRSKSVVVPSVGGFAALSFRYSNAKVSFGYRAEKYFAAMDGGMDVRKTYDQNFFGPYATISIGIGG